MRVNPFRRSRHARRFWQKPAQLEDAVTDEVPTVPDDAKALAIAGLRRAQQRQRPAQPDVQWYRDGLGRVTVPPPPAPGGAT